MKPPIPAAFAPSRWKAICETMEHLATLWQLADHEAVSWQSIDTEGGSCLSQLGLSKWTKGDLQSTVQYHLGHTTKEGFAFGDSVSLTQKASYRAILTSQMQQLEHRGHKIVLAA